MINALILAGGKGTRLYPLSRENEPKQFLKIINNKSFLRNTVDRISPIISKQNIYIVTNNDYIERIYKEVYDIDKNNIFPEPLNKETATCIGLSCVRLLKKDKDALLVVLPSDHYIENEKSFRDTILEGLEIAEKRRGIVTIGIAPTRPETGYGYIQMGERVNGKIPSFKVERFVEKPNSEVAKDLLLDGNYLWNSGMFIFRADVYLREMEKYLPKMYKNMMTIYQELDTPNEINTINEQYALIDGISVDFGIMQKTRKGYVIKSEFLWDDIGSFSSLSRFLKENNGNFITGNTYLEGSEGCCIIGNDKLIIGFGIKDIVIVESKDVILVMDKDRDQDIKHLVNKLKISNEYTEFL